MADLVVTPRFERAYRRLVRRRPVLQSLIEDTLRRLAANPADPRLKTHHLSGQLEGLLASSVTYDCRIVFSRGKHPKTRSEVLTLLNIGSHDEVY